MFQKEIDALLPKKTDDSRFKAIKTLATTVKSILNILTGLGVLGEVVFELAADINPYKRGKPIRLKRAFLQLLLGAFGS